MSVSVMPAAELPMLRSRRARVGDVLLAVALGALLVRSALLPMPHRAITAPPWLAVITAVAAAAAVASRRVAALTALVVAVVATVACQLMGVERDSFLAVALVGYIVAATRPPKVSAPAMACAGTLALIGFALTPLRFGDAPPDWWRTAATAAAALAVQAAGWALGLAVYRQRRYLAAVRRQAQEQLRAEKESSGRALAEERLRIARELHDIVAHAISVITVQAGVARHVAATRPDQAGQALAAIETTGRQGLHDMRQLLGVLRDASAETTSAPAPGLCDVAALCAGTQAAGIAVELSVRGTVRPLPAAIELSAYRIVQEALTNTVKHAATDHARVALQYGADELTVEVTDDGAGTAASETTPGGHGIVGMRERAALHGGTCTAGPLPLRGFRVAARIPVPAGDPAVGGPGLAA
ncbi:sensor histidine kinase [Streptomyces gilvus]|uniref:sensor histidine kinase n=1 Tax=Streptomyces gilvus TaxID=2920937 RepID=UPI001F0F0359|nr:sensor histidine kinase [Streptomyces sp. CME 23]MCH5676855.1 sensor histidine kinase [Streptomyces sp. CME 23]